MRKLPLVFLLFIFTSTIGRSQDAAIPTLDKFRFGLHFSPNGGWMKSNDNTYTINGLKLGYSFGLITEYNFGKRYALISGVNLVKINASRAGEVTSTASPEGPAGSSRVIINFSMQYLEIPLALKLKTNQIGALTYFGKFGLAPGLCTKASHEFNGRKVDFSNSASDFRAGLLIGLGTEYNISGSTNILLGIDFNGGFTTIYSDKDIQTTTATNLISLNLGVYF